MPNKEDIYSWREEMRRHHAATLEMLAEIARNTASFRTVAVPDYNTTLRRINEEHHTAVDLIAERCLKLEERLTRIENDDLAQVREALAEIQRLTLTPSVDTASWEGDAPAADEKGPGFKGLIESASMFPTGGALSTDEVLAAVDDGPPRRGDRVRLEGARSTGQTHIKDGWFDVIGRYDGRFPGDHDQFQVGSPTSIGMYWVYDADPGLKEVRRGTAS